MKSYWITCDKVKANEAEFQCKDPSGIGMSLSGQYGFLFSTSNQTKLIMNKLRIQTYALVDNCNFCDNLEDK